MAKPIINSGIEGKKKQDITSLEQQNKESLNRLLDNIKSEGFRKNLQLHPESDFLPWDDQPASIPTELNNLNKVVGREQTGYANSSYLYLIPAALFVFVCVCVRAKSITRMGTYVANNIKTGLTMFANKKPTSNKSYEESTSLLNHRQREPV